MLIVILLLIAVILFGLATFNVPSGNFSLIAGGLFCVALAMLLPLLGPLL